MVARGAAALALGVLIPGLAAAGSISISISPTVDLRDGNLAASVQVANSGDEAAHAVTPSIHFRNQDARATPREALAPKDSMTSQLTLPVGDLGNGRWPYRVAVDYADGNAYPFQALHVGMISNGTAPPAKVSVIAVDAEPVAGTGRLDVRLKNLAGTTRDMTVGVVLPEGVEVSEPSRRVSLDAWGEAKVSTSLVNRTALAGSRYPIFVTVEYDDDGVHQAALGHGVIEVSNPRSFFQANRSLLWVGAAVLVAGWVVLLGWQLASGRLRRAAPPRS
ncbi:MAG TPA: hypothetical protein VKU61_04105 [Candidatus Binatia bacterium]|nr:hypothetical protein [Candidatus Binatia bacterium]